MSKKYLVWKDESCNGKNIQWVEMTGKEFLLFKRNPQNKARKFIKLDNGVDFSDDIIYIEATKAQYDEWNREESRRHCNQKSQAEKNYSSISLDSFVDNEDECTLHEVIADEQTDIEETVLNSCKRAELQKAILGLSESERELISALYIDNDNGLSERVVSKELCLPITTVTIERIKRLTKSEKDLYKIYLNS